MNTADQKASLDSALRVAAEAQVSALTSEQASDAQERMLYELRLHQIELEMQIEALKEAHNALEESRDRYIDFYDHAPIGYLTITDQGLISDINLTAANMLGIERYNILQKHFAEFVAEEDWDSWHLFFVKALRWDAKSDCELALRCKDRSLCHVRLDCLRLILTGEATTLRIVLSDISERTQRDAQLRLQALVLDQIQDHVTVTDLDGMVTFVNQKERRTREVSNLSLLGKHVSTYDDSPRSDAIHHEIFATTLSKGVWNGKVENILADGSSIILHLRTSLVRDCKGKPIAVVGIGTDITEQTKAEKSLRQRDQYQRAVINNFPFMVWLKDTESRFLAVNDTFASNYGWPSAQSLIGRSDRDITTPELAEQYCKDDREVLARGASKQIEELLESGGQKRWMETYKSPITIDGKILGIVGFARDITERKQAEVALIESQELKRAILDSVASQIAVLNQDGEIMMVNAAWQTFAMENSTAPGNLPKSTRVGDNYLELLQMTAGASSREAGKAQEAILSVLQGRAPSANHQYSSNSGNQYLYFSMSVMPLKPYCHGVVVIHYDVTQRNLEEEEREMQRDTLVREVHHRIKNNLQGVAGLLQRELGEFLELDPRLVAAISQVHAIAEIHGLQASDPDEAVRLCESLRKICKMVSDLSMRQVEFHIEHEKTSFRPMLIDRDESVSIALILNELILNAAKHATDRDSPLTVSLLADGTSARIVIRNSVARSCNFDLNKGEGLGTGLRLVRSLLPTQGADLSYEFVGIDLMQTTLILNSPVVLAVSQKVLGN